jgi:hypothetical protein
MRNSLLALFLFGTGCNLADEVSEARAQLESALSTQRMASMESDMVAAHRGGPLPTDPLSFAEDLAAFIESQAACSTVVEDGDTVTVDFGDVNDDCTYQGHTYGGVMVATIAESEGVLIATLQLDGLTDGIATLTGEVYIDLAESKRLIASDVHISMTGGCLGGERAEHAEDEGARDDRRGPPHEGEEGERHGPPPGPPPESDVVGERVQVPLDGSFEIGVIENGSRTMSAEGGDAEITTVDLATRAGEIIPESGSITMVGPPGTMTISFARIDADTIEVTLDGPRGEEIIAVDPVSGEAQ